jgi:hypothetical protein
MVSSYLSDDSTKFKISSDFFRIGGCCMILPCLNSQHTQLRLAMVRFLHTLAQDFQSAHRLSEVNELTSKLNTMATSETEDHIVAIFAFKSLWWIIKHREADLNDMSWYGACLEHGSPLAPGLRFI